MLQSYVRYTDCDLCVKRVNVCSASLWDWLNILCFDKLYWNLHRRLGPVVVSRLTIDFSWSWQNDRGQDRSPLYTRVREKKTSRREWQERSFEKPKWTDQTTGYLKVWNYRTRRKNKTIKLCKLKLKFTNGLLVKYQIISLIIWPEQFIIRSTFNRT